MSDAVPHADFGVLESVFDGGCAIPFGYELASPPTSGRGRWRRRTRCLIAAILMVGLHAALFLVWRSSRPIVGEVRGPDRGAGGIQLSLVSAEEGVERSSATDAVDAKLETTVGDPTPSSASAAAPASSEGRRGAGAAPPADGRAVGAVGEAKAAVASANPSSGFDPGAFASFAPLSFAPQSEPGFWTQVMPCFRGDVPKTLVMNVVLDESGVFVNAYKDGGVLAVDAPTQAETKAEEAVTDALRTCGPYKGMDGGVGKRLVLVVPAGATQVPAGGQLHG